MGSKIMLPTFSFVDRKTALKKMASETFDVAIIGGGITGAGVARDAASRGLKVALIEARDFASGTSSRSSKLIHGGIRYLENMEFGLVFEALSERARLFEIAPHLVHPLKFLIPIYKDSRVPAWEMGLGMWLYDALSLYEAPELHEYQDAAELRTTFPSLQQRDLKGGFTYYDAYMDDDRLVHETLRSAHGFGAVIANYTRALGATTGPQGLNALECEDVESGQRFSLKARHFIASVGPWTDRLGEVLFKNWNPRLRPSKGVHLTFHKDRFPLHDAVVMGAQKRIVFAIPRHEMVIVGTTDTDFKDDPSKVRTEPQDVDYLLEVVDNYFPGVQIRREDILACYAGVRPLVDDGSQTESKTSREHVIWTEHGNLTLVAGGKYTTYRRMAEQTIEEVLRHFSIEDRARFAHSRTLEPLNPLITEAWFERALREHTQWADVPLAVSRRLAERHGLEGELILQRARKMLPGPMSQVGWIWAAEALHAVDNTMCLHLQDFFLRRTPLVLARKDHGLSFVNLIADVMGERLGWTSAHRDEEINALQKQLEWDLSALI